MRTLLVVIALAAACSESTPKPADAAVDLAPCVGMANVDQPCVATAGHCTECKDGLACEPVGTEGLGRCRPVCQALPPPCTSGFCCDTSALLSGGGTSSTCEDTRLAGVHCDTLDGGF